MEFQETNGIARTASTMLEMLYLPPPHAHRFRNAFYAPRKVEPWNELLMVVYFLLFSFSTVSVGSCLLCIVDPWRYASSLSPWNLCSFLLGSWWSWYDQYIQNCRTTLDLCMLPFWVENMTARNASTVTRRRGAALNAVNQNALPNSMWLVELSIKYVF